MPRTDTLPATIALFAGPSPATGAHAASGMKQIFNVRSLNYNFDIPKEDIVVYGTHAPKGREQMSPSNVNLSFSYYLSDFENEKNLGFDVNTGTSSVNNILLGNTSEKNYFVFITQEGVDAVGKGGADGAVMGIGNGFISSYSIEGQVGSPPTANLAVQAQNMQSYLDGVAENIPALDANGDRITAFQFTIPTVTAGHVNKPPILKPRDMTLDLSNAGAAFHSMANICVQSFRISYDFNRRAIECLGSKAYRSRTPIFPINIDFSVEVLANDLISGGLPDIECLSGLYNASISIKSPSCTGTTNIAAKYSLSGLSLSSQDWSTSAGGEGQSLTLNWIGQIGSASDLTKGLFLNGVISY